MGALYKQNNIVRQIYFRRQDEVRLHVGQQQISREENLSRRIIPYLLIAPVFILFITFTVIPTISVVRLSFFRTNFVKSEYVGLANYARLFTDKAFLSSLYNSLLYVLIGTPLFMTFATGMTLLIYNTGERWQTFAKTFCYLPTFVGSIILCAVWEWIWHADNGIVNQILGTRVSWFSTRWLSIPPILIACVATGIGTSFVILSAVVNSFPQSSIDAAHIDGATWWQIKTLILLPALAKTIVLLSLLTMIGLFMEYYYINFLSPYSYATNLMWTLYHTAFRFSRYGRASAYSVVLTLIIMTVAITQQKLARRNQ